MSRRDEILDVAHEIARQEYPNLEAKLLDIEIQNLRVVFSIYELISLMEEVEQRRIHFLGRFAIRLFYAQFKGVFLTYSQGSLQKTRALFLPNNDTSTEKHEIRHFLDHLSGQSATEEYASNLSQLTLMAMIHRTSWKGIKLAVGLEVLKSALITHETLFWHGRDPFILLVFITVLSYLNMRRLAVSYFNSPGERSAERE